MKEILNKCRVNGTMILVTLFSIVVTSCIESDDGSDIAPTLIDPKLGLVPGSFVETIEEGQVAEIEIGAFTGVDSDVPINATWSMTGAISMTGTSTIPAGELTVVVPISLPDDLVEQADRTVTLTLTGGDLPLNDETFNFRIPISTTVTIIDDVLEFGIEDQSETVTEIDGPLEIELPFGGIGDTIDEVITIEYGVDASSTAVEGVDFTLDQPTLFTYNPAVDTLVEFPSISITLLDDILANDSLELTVNVLNVSGSEEVDFDATAGNSVTYTIVNDYKIFSLSTDTIYVDSASFAAGFSVDILLGGPGSITQEASIEFNADAGLASVLEPNVSSTFNFVPGVSSLTYSASLDTQAFTFDPSGSDTTFFQLDLENVNSLNGDEEIMINSTADQLILGLIDPE